MKMPGHRFFPPSKPYTDIFGLPHLSLLAQAFESEDDRRKRVTKIEEGVATAFRAAVSHLGEEQARLLFSKVMRRPKRGPGKALAADRDHRLLIAHDEAIQTGESIAALSVRLRLAGTELGNTPAAIATHIRKLVRERAERQRAAAVQARYWRMAARNDPPTIASGIVATPRKK
jgi:hypothetical protein